MKFGSRIVEENDDFIVYLPADGKFAYGMDILPKKHVSSISDFTDSELRNLGIALRNAVKRLVSVTPGVCYNVCFYSAPKGYEYNKYFHFYAQIIPRIGHMAGFEFSTGCYINSVLPEDGAKILREIDLTEK
jgi:UDPglucose--hexose-1-phosphate uridylyltransferase